MLVQSRYTSLDNMQWEAYNHENQPEAIMETEEKHEAFNLNSV